MAARKRGGLRPDGYCRECGEKLEGLRERWCSSQCASRVYSRARRIAFEAFVPPNAACVHCGNEAIQPGTWFCDDACRAEYRAAGNLKPSRYDRPEFFT